MRKILQILIWLIPISAVGQDQIIKSFLHLDSISFETISHQNHKNFIKFNSSISTVYNEKSDIVVDYTVENKYQVSDNSIKLIKTKINTENDKYYFITHGIIDYPIIGFTIFDAESPNRIIGQIPGASLIVPGNGNFYAINSYSIHFPTRKKFSLINNEIIEIKQPFYSVDLDSYALNPIVVYSDIDLKKKLATIPKNGKIEVLVCVDSNSSKDSNIYLVRTDFGLIGWAKLRVKQHESFDVKGLLYNGS
ncbi:MAG: hypothetical protein JXR62_07075 [Bacilli bacterium]|nr:hypothetical protein [Bacteroidales bacterium]MBN2605564.1 hypothetical protein [Bacilli bacterium]